MASAQYMLVTSIVTDSKRSFLDAKDSRIMYKNNPEGIFLPISASWEVDLPCCIITSFITHLLLPVFPRTIGPMGVVMPAGSWLQAASGFTGPKPQI